MSRLDLLRKSGDSVKKKESKAKSLVQPATNNSSTDDDFAELGELFTETNVITKETEDYDVSVEEDNEDDLEANIIEIDMGDISDTHLFSDDEDTASKEDVEIEETKDIEPEIIETVYDVKCNISIVLEDKDYALTNFLTIVKNGGFEVRTEEVLIIGDIVEFSVHIPEFSEQLECFAKVICVFPKEVRTMTSKSGNKYWVQFFDAQAKSVNDLISKYLMGYKGKKE